MVFLGPGDVREKMRFSGGRWWATERGTRGEPVPLDKDESVSRGMLMRWRGDSAKAIQKALGSEGFYKFCDYVNRDLVAFASDWKWYLDWELGDEGMMRSTPVLYPWCEDVKR